eukprot:366269-Chlamydomonas_euryale.AAC.10
MEGWGKAEGGWGSSGSDFMQRAEMDGVSWGRQSRAKTVWVEAKQRPHGSRQSKGRMGQGKAKAVWVEAKQRQYGSRQSKGSMGRGKQRQYGLGKTGHRRYWLSTYGGCK